MVTVTKQNRPEARKKTRAEGPSRADRIPGICVAARALGVSRQHLYQCVKGKRRASQELIARLLEYNSDRDNPIMLEPTPLEDLSPEQALRLMSLLQQRTERLQALLQLMNSQISKQLSELAAAQAAFVSSLGGPQKGGES